MANGRKRKKGEDALGTTKKQRKGIIENITSVFGYPESEESKKAVRQAKKAAEERKRRKEFESRFQKLPKTNK